jgi:hypothetical protein
VTLIRSALRTTVYTSDRSDSYGSHGWQEQPALDAVVRQKRGATPSECWLTVRRDPTADGPAFSARPGEVEVDLDPSGEQEQVLHPWALPRHTFVKVECFDGGIGSILFLGRVWSYRGRGASRTMTALALDYRAELRRIRCKGSRWRRPVAGDEVWLPDAGPHFNAGGRPDQMYDDSESARDSAFITPAYNRDDSGQIDASKDCAVFWRCGDALNCLRDLFNSDPASQLESTADFLEWPAADETEDWYLFADSYSAERRVMDLDCTGRSLAWALDQVIGAASDVDWWLQPTGEDTLKLVWFSQWKNISGDTDRYTLAVGAPGDDPAVLDVIDYDLTYDWTETYDQVRAVGARKVVDVTLDTAATSWLAPGWTSADETAWEALPESTDAERKAKLHAYPDVFCTWVAVEDLDWDSVLDTSGYREGARKCFARLCSYSLVEGEGADQPVHLRMQVWRSTDGGSTWERLPGQVTAQPLRDRVGFRLPTIVRHAASYGGESGYVWSHNSGTAYDMRLTIAVEADERLVKTASYAVPTDCPPGELFLPAGPRYRHEARRDCWLPTDGGAPASPVLNSATDAEFADGTTTAIQDDGDELETLAERRLDLVNAPRLSGTVTLKYICPWWQPGMMLEELDFGGEIGAVSVRRAVAEVVYDANAQTTTLHLMGI